VNDGTINDDDMVSFFKESNSKTENVCGKKEKVMLGAFNIEENVPKKSNNYFLTLKERWRVDLNFQMLVLRSYLFMKPIVTRGRMMNEKSWTFDCDHKQNIIEAVSYMNRYGYFVVKSKNYHEMSKKYGDKTIDVNLKPVFGDDSIELSVKKKGTCRL
jgi:hypothetical protein